jgi:type III pantothenate kinase
MSGKKTQTLVAVDVGNSAIHAGCFRGGAHSLPTPESATRLDASEASLDALGDWTIANHADQAHWCIASVNHRTDARLRSWLAERFPAARASLVEHNHVPLRINVEQPGKVGIDRLMAAVAADSLRRPEHAAIVIDAGTAITVDAVSVSGAFLGGAILPGMRMAAQALDRYTEKLPLVETRELISPPPIGRGTQAAIESGLFWGTVGALVELVRRTGEALAAPTDIFFTGGDAPRLTEFVHGAVHVPHLVLSGLALCCARQTGAIGGVSP